MPAPLRALHQQFRHSLDKAVAEGQSRSFLARKSRFTHVQALDTQLRLVYVSATPLLIGRLTALATIIGYTGPIFQDDAVPVAAEPQAAEVVR